jgi:glycosyltransferase involved in cell wall biosynthesis
LKGFSIIIPVYNEADILCENAEKLLAHLEPRHKTFEIIIGSNGSIDRTASLGKKLSRKHPLIHFFHLPQRGVGYAFRHGVQMARYDYVVSLDMDLSVDLDFIERALGLLDRGYVVVVGSKKMGEQQRSLCARFLLGLPFEDYSIAAKAYRRKVLLKYLDQIDHGTSYVIDVICLVDRGGGQIIETPVWCVDYRTSKFNIIHEGVYRFSNLFRLWWSLKGGA